MGHWWGVHVRLHMFFLLFGACTLYISRHVFRDGSSEFVWIALGSLSLLLASLILHELGHYLAAVRLGGGGDEIVIGPLGGLASMRMPHAARSELLVHLAGPAVNLGICMACGTVLFLRDTAQFTGLLHPLAPGGLVEGPPWLRAVKLGFWINWVLLLVNLLPAFPFDGGRALRAALSSLRPDVASRHAAFIVANLAKMAAVGLLILAWVLRGDESNAGLPVWFSLVLLAILLWFSAKQEEDRTHEADAEHELFDYDFSQGYTSLERAASHERDRPQGPVARWLERRRRLRLQRQRQIEAEEERRVDEILGRLHACGMHNLSEEDRSLLKRVSARYRQRNSEDA